jgi:Fe-S cluster assembly iron-binding protein IscA
LGLALDEPKENEETIQVNGIDLLISDDVKPAASVNKIDYIKSPQGEGFFIAPKSGESGCGESGCGESCG